MGYENDKLNLDEYLSLLYAGKFVKAEDLRISSLPRTLYKFVSLDDSDGASNNRKFDSLANNLLWCSLVEKFNDPYEMKGMYIDEGSLGGICAGLKDKLHDVLDLPSREIAVASLSRNGFDNLLMWAYYTNNHQGFCIEYSVEPSKYVYEVVYNPKRISANRICERYCAATIAEMRGDSRFEKDIDLCVTLLSWQMCIKHTSWEHEREYRVMAPRRKAQYGGNVPLDDIGLKTRCIVAGRNCSDNNLCTLKGVAKELGCLPVKRIKESKDSFALLVD